MSNIGDIPEMVRTSPPPVQEAQESVKTSGHTFKKIAIATGVTSAVAFLGIAALGTLAMPAIAVITVPVFLIAGGVLAAVAFSTGSIAGGTALLLTAHKVVDAVAKFFNHTSSISMSLNDMMKLPQEMTKVPVFNTHTLLETEFEVPQKVDGELLLLDRITIGGKEHSTSLPSVLDSLHMLCDGNEKAAITLTSLINPTFYENQISHTAIAKHGDVVQVTYTRVDGSRLALNIPLKELSEGKFKHTSAEVLNPVLPTRLLDHLLGTTPDMVQHFNEVMTTPEQREEFINLVQDMHDLQSTVYHAARQGILLDPSNLDQELNRLRENALFKLAGTIENDHLQATFMRDCTLLIQHAGITAGNTQIVTDHILRTIYPDNLLTTDSSRAPKADRLIMGVFSAEKKAFDVDLNSIKDPKERFIQSYAREGYDLDAHFKIPVRGLWQADEKGEVLNSDGTRNFIKGSFYLDLAFFDEVNKIPIDRSVRFDVDLRPFLNVSDSPDKFKAVWELIAAAALSDFGIDPVLKDSAALDLLPFGMSKEEIKKIAEIGDAFRVSLGSQLAVIIYEQSHPL